MIRLANWPGIAAVLLLASARFASAEDDPAPLKVTVKAGEFARKNTPIRFEVAGTRLAPSVRKALELGPVPLRLTIREPSANPGARDDRDAGIPAQAEPVGGTGRVRITWVLAEEIAAGREAEYRLSTGQVHEANSPWTIDESKPGAIALKNRDRPVFRYNAAPVSNPGYKEIYARDAYIHPAYSPSGALITGDFSPFHPHHRGFFLAYERTKVGDRTPDFWNIQAGTGKVHAEGVESTVVGPVTARFSAKHRWDAIDKANGSKGVAVLRERWDVEAYHVPNQDHWLFDVTSTQQAIDKPVELLPYRYGGMAYRGPEPFVKGTLAVLTSDGKGRFDGDQKPARWVDLTGPIADGSTAYAGAMIADHPSNPNQPGIVRIHPITLPFFCYVPAHDRPLTIAKDAPTVFRYRVLIHDGKPDAGLDERTARDFSDPPTVVVD